MFDELHEECGVFAACYLDDAPSLTYYGLHSLQHRGQEASGISVLRHQEELQPTSRKAFGHQQPDPRKAVIDTVKGKGLTIDVFSKDSLERLQGNCAIGHVRYSTAGGQEAENIQPISARGLDGPIAIVHNGQIVNEKELRRELEEAGCIFQGTSDSEVILHMIMREKGTMMERVKRTARKLEGAFSFLVLHAGSIIAVRDKNGLRPLSYARRKQGFLISSETCAFEVMGMYDSVTVRPGEVIEFREGAARHDRYAPEQGCHMCAMEYIYFARPDSVIEDINVHTFRKESGQILAARDARKGFKADLVVGVPDSSLSAAIGYAEESGIPMESGLIKNRFVARTFIQPTQAQRDRGVRMKLSPVSDVISGKSVIMIDDSIVRGTTSRRIVSLLKEAGAKEVHVRIASPMLVSPCFYGVDTSTKKELIAARMSCEEIREYLNADSLEFMETEDLQTAAHQTGLCTACFDGNYCTPLFSYQQALEDPEC